MLDPYDILGVDRDADTEQLKAAYRRHAKETHPDSGGDGEAFDRVQKAYELLLDPVRRKGFDETGYDLQFADAKDLQGLLVIEKLVNEIVLDEREPGTFDPVARMRAALNDEIRKARFSIREMEGHRTRLQNHLKRLGKRAGNDILGYMLRARMDAITGAIVELETKIGTTEHAYEMLDGYTYLVDAPKDDRLARNAEMEPAMAHLRKV